MSFLKRLMIVCSLMIVGIAGASFAAANNTRPLPNILGSNGLSAPQMLSSDPQISQAVFSATGVVITESTLTTVASAAEFPITVWRGAIVDTDASGFHSIRRNGLYKATINANCTGATTVTGRLTAQISNDGGTTWAQIAGADARNLFLTGALQQNLGAEGYVSITQTATNLGAGNVIIALRGTTSDASDMTCANGGGLIVERMDGAQPVTYP